MATRLHQAKPKRSLVPSSPASRSRWPPLCFAALIVAGLVVRTLAMRSTWQQPDGDEAAGLLMALRASQGHLSLLFWGGNYGGALITWLEAPLVAIFGLHIWIFTVVNTVLTLFGAVLLWAIGKRFLPPVAAAVAGGTFFFYPALWLFWSDREYVFWVPAIVAGLATCLVILRWRESRRAGLLYLAGLLGGLTIWLYPLVAALVGPPALFFVWSLRRDRRALARVVGSALVGVAPWLAYFAVHGSSALQVQANVGSRLAALRHAVTEVLPTALVGGQRRSDVLWTLTDATARRQALLGAVIYLLAVIYTIVAVARRDAPRSAVGLSVVVWPFVLVLGHVPVSAVTFRYGFIIVPALLLLVTDLLARVRLPLVVGAFALATSTYTISTDTSGFAAAPACNPSLRTTTAFLMAQNRTTVWASYWLSSPLDVCSQRHVVAASVAPRRDYVSEQVATETSPSTYVVFPDNGLDNELKAWTTAHPVPVQRIIAPGGYAVWEFEGRVLPGPLKLDSAL